MIRKPAVSSQFYDGDPSRLYARLATLVGSTEGSMPAIGIIAPHAGYMYSGGVAGAVYAQVEVPETVVVLGVNHTGLGAPAAVMSSGAWAMPMGSVPIAEDLAELVLQRSKYLEDDIHAHMREHSLEVQVPFLQYRQKKLSIVPICLGLLPYHICEEIGSAVAEAVRQLGRPVLLVASTDMTHYESQQRAEAKDRFALDKILSLDPRGLFDTVRGQGISMCGVIPATSTLVAALALGARSSRLIRYATSGDVTGDYQRVVGYAGLVID
jgi:AmmeMemoRadiSam system protein B